MRAYEKAKGLVHFLTGDIFSGEDEGSKEFLPVNEMA